MRLRFIIAAALATLLLPALPASADDADVQVGNFFYRSTYVRVDPGDTVTWHVQADSSSHTMTSRPESAAPFDSGEIAAGQSFAFTFATPGRYVYTCKIHPRLGQRGVIQVGPDTTKPVLEAPKVKRGARAVRISFRLSEDATVKAAFKRGKVVKTVKTPLLVEGKRFLVFKPKKLEPGSYTVRLTATDRERNASKTVKATFSVPKPRR